MQHRKSLLMIGSIVSGIVTVCAFNAMVYDEGGVGLFGLPKPIVFALSMLELLASTSQVFLIWRGHPRRKSETCSPSSKV